MNIYIYSDESGVLDKKHNQYFVFGGVMFLDKKEKDKYERKYISAEKNIRKREKASKDKEMKASAISNTSKHKLYKVLKDCYKFGIVVQQDKVLERIFESKKDKQRYLDFVYKVPQQMEDMS